MSSIGYFVLIRPMISGIYLPGEEDSWLEHDVHLSELPVEVAGLLAALAARAPAQNQDEFYSFLSQGSHSVHLNLLRI